MLRITSAPRALRYCFLGLATLSFAVIVTTDTADARKRSKHRTHHARKVDRSAYNPAFASIIVDANSGAVLQSSNADAPRHPASLTKIMTLYLLFEQIEAGRLKLDSELEVSEFASRQAPTKLGLRPGQTLRVEDAIKGLVTRSANDAAVVIAEAIGGDEDSFARMMTRKARALGMTRTVYRNASGLPNDSQITTARDQSTLGRAIQDRFPRHYRYFATASFNYRGQNIRNHNRLIGSVEGVDGIKTGYTRASGFNLVTSIRRGNRHLVGVVLGGRSGGARDAKMRSLLAEHIEEGATRRTVAAISERNPANTALADADDEKSNRPAQTIQVQGAVQVASAESAKPVPMPLPTPVTRSIAPPPAAIEATSIPTPQPKPAPAPMTSGVVSSEPTMAAVPGSSAPITPVRVKTLQVRAPQVKVASVSPTVPVAAPGSAVQDQPRTTAASDASQSIGGGRSAMPPQQPANHGTGQGVLGVLPASSVNNAMASAGSNTATALVQQNGAIKPAAAARSVAHSGWIVQIGALENEDQARARLEAARDRAHGLLSKAEPFTEPVAKGEKTLYRARFAGGFERSEAEAVCRALKRSDFSCIAIKN